MRICIHCGWDIFKDADSDVWRHSYHPESVFCFPAPSLLRAEPPPEPDLGPISTPARALAGIDEIRRGLASRRA